MIEEVRGLRADLIEQLSGKIVGNFNPTPPEAVTGIQEPKPVKKSDLAIWYLKRNPELAKMSGRELHKHFLERDIDINYKYWNDARDHVK